MVIIEHNDTTEHAATMQPILTMRLVAYTARVHYRSKEIPFLDHLTITRMLILLQLDMNEIYTSI